MPECVMDFDEAWVAAAMRGATADEMAPIFPWMVEMDACDHDPIHHAEGSPWVHTTLVAAALECRPEMLVLADDRRQVLRLAAWLHDVGKPATTIYEPCLETGVTRVRQPGHAALGAKIAWQSLIDAGCDPVLVRNVHALVGWHMRPTHLPDMAEGKILDRVLRFDVESCGGSWRELLALTRADQDGRIALDGRNKHASLDVLEAALDAFSDRLGLDIRAGGIPFPSSGSRMRVLREGAFNLFLPPHEPAGSRVTMMSGLPGSGKGAWLQSSRPDLPVASTLDEATRYLKDSTDFAWNSNALSRAARQKLTRLALEHDALIELVSMDVPLEQAVAGNRMKASPAPEDVLRAMAQEREPAIADESHRLISIDKQGAAHVILGDPSAESAHQLREISDLSPQP